MKPPSMQQIDAVLKLPPPKRYEYLAKRVADREEIWGLKTADGWCMYGTPDGRQCIPVWPLKEFAALCATADWADAAPEPIPLDRWLSAWEQGMTKDGVQVAVFPVPEGGQNATMKPAAFNEALRYEMSRHE